MKVAAALIIAALLAAGTLATTGAQDTGAESFSADLQSLNDSGVTGTADIQVDGDQITVSIEATGMVPDQEHMQHIHGLADGTDATCPDASADEDGDGLVSLEEGLPFYGPVVVPLEPYPTADASGNVSFTGTFTLPEDTVLENHVIVLHGMEVEGTYEAALPVACGTIEAEGAAGGGDATPTAAAPAPTEPAAGQATPQATAPGGVAAPDTGDGSATGGSGSASLIVLGLAVVAGIAGTSMLVLTRRRST